MCLGPQHGPKFLFLGRTLQPSRGTAGNKNHANYLFFRKNTVLPRQAWAP